MDLIHEQKVKLTRLSLSGEQPTCQIHGRLSQWQEARSWARMICEAELMWRLEPKELKRLGALELSQLIEEIPPSQRRRVDKWLYNFSANTRFCCKSRK